MIIELEHIKPLVQRLGDLEVRSAPASGFNGKLMVWFHPHRGGKTAQRWLKRRLLKSFSRTDFFMPSFLKKIDRPVALEIASEMHLLVAAIFETARLNGRPYEEVVLVAYGEGVLILRKVEEFGNGHLQGHTLPNMAIPVNDSWNEIRHISRTVFIARGETPHAPHSLTLETDGVQTLWDKVANRLIQIISS